MGKALLYECFAGISGDMHLGALIDIGVPAEVLRQELGRLELAGEFALVAAPAVKMGIAGTRATVQLAPTAPERPARGLRAILALIERAGYPPAVRDRAAAMFQALAEAEAKIHGQDVEAVHFHEVGATDSIADIVGAAIGLHHLGVETAYCGPVELGQGTVRCAHGVFPVPAPATAELLRGAPCTRGVRGEATTPTGAAILKCAVADFAPPASFAATAIGYGVGQRDFAVPNVLRLSLGTAGADEPEAAGTLLSETNWEVECNIDDMPAEAFGPLVDALFAQGAKDVFLTPVVMKKARPGTKVSALVARERLDDVLAALFAGSTTIGARLREVAKRMLPRAERRVATSFGEVRVKVATLPDGRRRWKCEHDDIAAIAARAGADYLATKADIDRQVEQALG